MRFDLHFLKILKVPVLLGSFFIIASLIYYFFWVRDQSTYLMNRNFRLLATIGQQIEGSIESQAKIIESLIQDEKIQNKAKLAARLAPSLEVLELPCSLPELSCPLTADPPRKRDNEFWSFIPTWESNARGEWLNVDYFFGTERSPYYRARLNLSKILSNIRRQEVEETAFDAVLLAATDGRVIYQQGDSELRLTHLDNLLAGNGHSEQKNLQFNALSRSTNFENVQLSGANYSLFIQPCCRTIQSRGSNPVKTLPFGETANSDQSQSQAASKHPQFTSQSDRGWVICGLVSQDRFRHSSFTLSFSILVLVTALIMLAIFSWPFLKLSLIGPQQRVRMIDVRLVALCGLLGLSLMTIFWLDFAVYHKLKVDNETQLIGFAEEIKANLRKEIEFAYQQLAFLEEKYSKFLSAPEENRTEKDVSCVQREPAEYPYRDFFIANAQGVQIFKCSLSGKTSPQIRVEERQYFKDAKAGRIWPPPSDQTAPSAPDHGYVLESVRSWTTGKMRAVISKPVQGHPGKVAALSIPMLSVIKSSAPPGVGFAVIDESGKVLFHSDAQRNLSENFFAEADWDRQLMAAVTTRVKEPMDIRYWGKAHSAYLTPIDTLREVPWFLITFSDKQPLRTFNLVLLITTMLFLVVYVTFYILVGLVIALANPNYRATWLWPAAEQTRNYHRLSLSYLVLLILATVVTQFLTGAWLLLAAMTLPFAVWLITYLTLRSGNKSRQQTSDSPQDQDSYRPPLIISYSVFGALLLALVAIWPTVAYFKTAYDLQMRAFIKYGQLKLALAIGEREKRISTLIADQSEGSNDAKRIERAWRDFSKEHPNVYCNFFYHSSIGVNSGRQNPLHHTGSTTTQNSESLLRTISAVLLPRALEDWRSHHPTLSVILRMLLRDSAANQAWQSSLNRGRLTFHWKSGDITVLSTVPPLRGDPSLLLIMALVIVLLLLWIVRFVCRHIFLIDLAPPIWRDDNGKQETATSYNIFLVCNEEQKKKLFNCPNHINLEKDYKQWAQEDDPEHGWRERLSDVLSSQQLSRNVFIDHFEYRLYDQTYNERKLAILDELIQVHRRRVVIFSSVGSSLLLKHHKSRASNSTQTVDAGSQLNERWIKLLSSFILIDAKYLPEELIGAKYLPGEMKSAVNGVDQPKDESGWRSLRGARNWMRSRLAKPIIIVDRADPVLVNILPTLQSRANGEKTWFDHHQLLAEIDDRAANDYSDLWDSCTSSEKMVLFHLAEDGFVNGRDRKTIRRLMARGLIQRGPHFQLISEAFRRFVLSAQCRSEAAAIKGPPPSAWDMIKLPFLAVLLASIVFFFATQRELFNSSVAVITGLTAALPALIKLLSMATGKPVQGSERS
jgi:hypothetical protein